ncbi:ABC transporter permease [Leucobacter weissii]|uniref:ABC transporter permease n=1 Tax=Leucobacter weissii TaxID=1983706 RepID=A0A939MGL2_9MICO|nr:ABC transporter permease [Leucobacter weissii]
MPGLIAAAAVIVALALLAAILGPILYPDATRQEILDALLPAGAPGHPLGTDQLGRDIWQLSVAGARSAIAGPLVIALGSAVLGVLLGTLAGYRRGVVDFAVSRWSDLLFALPVVLVAIVVVGVFGAGYWLTVALLILLFSPSDIRIVRAAVLEQSARPYIESARVAGVGSGRIMFVHILPNVLPLVVTNLLLNVAFALVALSSLSFLGLGVPPGSADWGRQLADGRLIMADNPAAVWVPALLIIAVACAVNLLGDWLSERYAARGTAEGPDGGAER